MILTEPTLIDATSPDDRCIQLERKIAELAVALDGALTEIEEWKNVIYR